MLKYFNINITKNIKTYPPWHVWDLGGRTVRHLDTICYLGQGPPPLLPEENISFQMWKYFITNLMIFHFKCENISLQMWKYFITHVKIFHYKCENENYQAGIPVLEKWYFHQELYFCHKPSLSSYSDWRSGSKFWGTYCQKNFRKSFASFEENMSETI